MATPQEEVAQYFSLLGAADGQAEVAEVGPPEAVEDLVDSAVAEEVLEEEAPARAGNSMRTREFLSRLGHDHIVKAIRDAESKTSGQIRVFVQRGKLEGDPLIAAQKRFHRLSMHKTGHRNGILIFVAPRAHKFAVVGDQAVHEKCGDEFWQRLVAGMREHFRNEKFSHALVEAIEEAGKVLATYFPKESALANDLSEKVNGT